MKAPALGLLLLCATLATPSQAVPPSYSFYGWGLFTTAGWYPMYYNLTATDPDNDFLSLRCDVYLEYQGEWKSKYGWGDYTTKYCESWGESEDGYSPLHVTMVDTQGTYFHVDELVF
jgi:hypothetical protein